MLDLADRNETSPKFVELLNYLLIELNSTPRIPNYPDKSIANSQHLNIISSKNFTTILAACYSSQFYWHCQFLIASLFDTKQFNQGPKSISMNNLKVAFDKHSNFMYFFWMNCVCACHFSLPQKSSQSWRNKKEKPN